MLKTLQHSMNEEFHGLQMNQNDSTHVTAEPLSEKHNLKETKAQRC